MTDEEKALKETISKLSNSAVWLATHEYFGVVMMGKPILFAPQNDDQDKAYIELLDAGFCHGDVERGVYGYRSTFKGQAATEFFWDSWQERVKASKAMG